MFALIQMTPIMIITPVYHVHVDDSSLVQWQSGYILQLHRDFIC